MPPGRGPGRGRGPPVARVARANQAHRAAAAAPPPAAAKEPAPAPAPAEDPVAVVCGFPRCEELPEYGFADEKVAQCCATHKSDDMVLLVADPDSPKEASLALVREYKELKPKFEALKDAPSQADACEKGIKNLSATVNKEEVEIDKLTKAIELLSVNITKEEAKPKPRLVGRGKLGFKQDQDKIDKWTKEKETNVAKLGKIKGQHELDVVHLDALKEELPGVKKPYREYKEIEAKMAKLKADAIDAEASALYLACRGKGKKKEMNDEGEVIFNRLLTFASTAA